MIDQPSENGLRVQIAEPYMFAGGDVAIRFVRAIDVETRRVAHVNREMGWLEWEEIDPSAQASPTLQLTDDIARALLEALQRHYQGASDTHTVRADLLHERGRVDKMIAAVIDLADKALDSALEN